MKHLSTELIGAEIARLADEAGLSIQPAQLADLALHLARVLDANRSFNLTAIKDPAEAARLHVLDSLTALPEVQAAPAGGIADIGSGAGYPGIPLAVVSGRPTVLVESVGKKARFLEETCSVLSSRYAISARNTRVEDLGRKQAGSFAVVTARALSALPSIVELAAPLLHREGVFVAMKGPISNEELAAGDRAAEIVGLERVSRRDLALPGGGESRCIVAYRRTRAPRIALPRETGYAQHKPLG